MTDRSYSQAGALRRSEGTGGRRPPRCSGGLPSPAPPSSQVEIALLEHVPQPIYLVDALLETDIAGLSPAEELAQWAPHGPRLAYTVADLAAPDRPLTYASPHFTTLTGYSRAEAVGENCKFLQGALTEQEPISYLRSCIRRRVVGRTTITNYRKDGTMFRNRLLLYPVRLPDSARDAMFGVQFAIPAPAPAPPKPSAYVAGVDAPGAQPPSEGAAAPLWSRLRAPMAVYLLGLLLFGALLLSVFFGAALATVQCGAAEDTTVAMTQVPPRPSPVTHSCPGRVPAAGGWAVARKWGIQMSQVQCLWRNPVARARAT